MNRLLNFFDQRPKIGKLLSISFVALFLVVSFYNKNTRITKLLQEKNYVELTSVSSEKAILKMNKHYLFIQKLRLIMIAMILILLDQRNMNC